MAYRTQEVTGLCKICRAPTSLRCARCADPLCEQHLPEEDERCQDCENLWLERASRRELRSWGPGSHALVKAAKWTGRTGGAGVALMFVSWLVHAIGFSEQIAAFFGLLGALLLLAFPFSLASLAALPIVRAAERTLDSLEGQHRRKFLEERVAHALPPAESASD